MNLMRILSLTQRLRLYVMFITFSIFVVLFAFLVLPLIAPQIATGFAIFLIPFLSHGYLGANLMGRSKKSRYLSARLLMSLLSLSLMVFATWVDESINDPHFYSRTLDGGFTYLIYFVWTTVVLWEILYRIMRHQKNLCTPSET